ncbi:class I SAM-dependent methyltransferase [Micromonospora halophytica]|uniref:Methyltransferase domain-containing protein n=1 Tax=Micromonospora halophytica TaxID=47864 RepID=A0A1C5HKG7_9ACTN|nr:class I SAM-dependent methyltransferase [Micromonospora halophytica]SCG46071.1 Methyltransferase domain-containing protein [Micromonospora halophytica]
MTLPATDPFADWLALREPADAAARTEDLVDRVRARLAPDRPLVVHDLGSGTGSMARWLAPRLPGPQHWTLYDRDPGLLDRARAQPPVAADGSPVTVRTRQTDITRLTAADLSGAGLVTASALLDMLTGEEIDRIVAACAGAGCPSLFVLSVVGRVTFDPADPLDAEVAAAFDDHQRRTVDGRTLLGPDAAAATVAAFARHGVPTEVRSTPWRLGPAQAALTAEWFTGWLEAAVEQRPELADRTVQYARRRLTAAAAGELTVTVGHDDLLAGAE